MNDSQKVERYNNTLQFLLQSERFYFENMDMLKDDVHAGRYDVIRDIIEKITE